MSHEGLFEDYFRVRGGVGFTLRLVKLDRSRSFGK